MGFERAIGPLLQGFMQGQQMRQQREDQKEQNKLAAQMAKMKMAEMKLKQDQAKIEQERWAAQQADSDRVLQSAMPGLFTGQLGLGVQGTPQAENKTPGLVDQMAGAGLPQTPQPQQQGGIAEIFFNLPDADVPIVAEALNTRQKGLGDKLVAAREAMTTGQQTKADQTLAMNPGLVNEMGGPRREVSPEKWDSLGLVNNFATPGAIKDARNYQSPDDKFDEFARREDYKFSLDAIKDKMSGGKGKREYSPSPLKKLIEERQELIDGGAPMDSQLIKAYNEQIGGVDVDPLTLSDEEIKTLAIYQAMGGKVPSFGRGKIATKFRLRLVKEGAAYMLAASGIPGETGGTPSEAAFKMLGEQADTKSIQTSLNFLDKQLSSMGSFVVNLNSQVDKVAELAKDLESFDTRILNMPLRAVRGKIVGSALQAKYDMYLTEIEGEIGKLATGASASVAELSATAQEKWAKIHDKNLSIKDMLSLLKETKEAANLRLRSVEGQLDRTRGRMVREKKLSPSGATANSAETNRKIEEALSAMAGDI